MFNLRSINQVRNQTTCDPHVTSIQDDMAIHDFDSVMVNVSIDLSKYFMVDSLIGNRRFSMNKNDMQQLKTKGNTQ